MMEPLSAVAAKTTGEAATAGPSMHPDQNDIERFEALISRPSETHAGRHVAVDGTTAIQPPAESAAVQPVTNGLENLGEVILQGMDRLRTTRDNHVEKVNALLESTGEKPMTFHDGIRLQFELMQLGLQQEVTTKAVDKTSQGVQTLFRNQ